MSLLALSLLVAIAMAVFVLVSATQQPWLGLNLSFDAERGGAVVVRARGPSARIPTGTVLTDIEGRGDRMKLVADDFVIEPDGSLATYAKYDAFLERQARLANMQASDVVTFVDATGGSWTVSPEPRRPLSSLPPDYWVQLVVGIVAWLISAAIWVFRPREASARYLLLSGVATLTFAPLAGIYSTRELALPRTLFHWTNDANFLGGSMFAAALVGLLLCYPRRLGPSWIGQSVVGLFVAWFVAQQYGAFGSMTFARRFLVMIAVLAAFVLAGVHYRLTRKDPIGRAALQWLLLSWLVTGSTFGLGILMPQLFGIDTSAFQGYGFSLFLLTYVGLAFGILRFRLFDLGEWWFRIMLWTLSVLLLVVLDFAFLLGLQLSSGLSLGLSLLACGLLWLPLRGWLWGRFVVKETRSERALFENVVVIAMTRDADERGKRFRDLLKETFDPLDIGETGGGVPRACVEEDGLALRVPAVADLPPLRLAYGHGGRRLFTRRDAARADDLAGMLRHVIESRDAYQKGASVERARIARDMHDNIGAQLVTALHSGENEQKDRLIKESLAELRSIIDQSSKPAALGIVLADVRREAAERLAVNGVKLDWPIARDELGIVAPELAHAVRSILRETLNNVVKHAAAQSVRVSIERNHDAFALLVEDDGVGFDEEAVERGHGLSNLKSRAEALGGTIRWTPGANGAGTAVALEIPLGTAPA